MEGGGMTSDDIREDLAAAKDPSRQADALMALLRSVGPGGRPQPQYFAAVLEHCVIGVKDKQPGHKRLGYAFLRTCADGVADSEWSAMLDSAAADMHSKDPDVAAAALAAPLAAPRRLLQRMHGTPLDRHPPFRFEGPEGQVFLIWGGCTCACTGAGIHMYMYMCEAAKTA